MADFKGKYVAGRDINITKRFKYIGSQFSFWVGVGFLCVVLIISLLLPCPTASQHLVIRIATAIGLAGIASVIPGFFNYNPQGVLKIGAGLAIFLLVYFINPASIINSDPCGVRQSISGVVLYRHEPLKNVQVSVGLLDEYDQTNGSGEFDIFYSGSLNYPVSINLKYGSIDTSFSLNSDPIDQLFIELNDTIPPLGEGVISEEIGRYISDYQNKISFKYQRRLKSSAGRLSSLEEVSVKYLNYEEIKARFRNKLSFDNGSIKLTTHKSIRAAGIQIDPMVPYEAYSLEDYSVFILNGSDFKNGANENMSFEFAFLNIKDVKFQITQIKRVSELEYLINIHFTENIRYIRTKVEYGENTDWMKIQSTNYYGLKPNETFVFRFENGLWNLVGVSG